MFLKNRNISSKIKSPKVTDYAALNPKTENIIMSLRNDIVIFGFEAIDNDRGDFKLLWADQQVRKQFVDKLYTIYKLSTEA